MAGRNNLSREKIVGAALEIADTQGIDALSMRVLGARLSVEAMALYYHFKNKHELVEAMLDAIHAYIRVPDDDAPWDDFIRQRSWSVVEVLSKHGWAAPIMESGVSPGQRTMEDRERFLSSLRRAGFDVENAVHAITLVDVFTYGFVAQLVQLSFSTKKEAAAVGKRVIGLFPAEKFPYMREMVGEHMMKKGYDPMDEFHYGLELIIAGLDRNLQKNPVHERD